LIIIELKQSGPCITEDLLLVGSHHWSKNLEIKLAQKFGLESDVAHHLSENYGDRSLAVASLATLAGRKWPLGKRLVLGYPFIEAEVRYACRQEYACTAVVIPQSLILGCNWPQDKVSVP
jgi:glycerol-3-phosphate dehydrogenase